MKLQRKIALLTALLLIASLPLITAVIADAGDFSGNSSFGGSSSDDDNGIIGTCLNVGLRAACVISDCAVESGACTRGQTVVAMIFIGAILIVGYFLLRKFRGKSGAAARTVAAQPVIRSVPNAADGATNPISGYQALDPNFSAEDLKEELQNLFFRMLSCREQRDAAPIEPYFTERAYRTLSEEIRQMTEKGEHEHADRTAVLEARVKSFRRGETEDSVFAEIFARTTLYRTNDETGKVVSGSNKEEQFLLYAFTLTRSVSVKTAPRDTGVIKRHCPNCGAPISENETVKCPYCDSVLPLRADAWRIDAIRATFGPGSSRTPSSMLTPIDTYRTVDGNFSPDGLKNRLQDLYLKMQDCCTKRNYEPIRPFFADSFYQQLNRQAERLKAANQTNYVEDISVLSVDLRGYYQDKGEDVIIAEICARITDYTLNDVTRALVSGSKTRKKIMVYEYALSRPIGRKTGEKSEESAERYCPNCGAPLSVNESVKCPYCGAVISFADHDWTVYSIKGISQQTL
ncbi:MAG: TIM44-like domain-containing protein [Clostridia bacterium]|nr:TIM44-like domain-containing protein [Clostridia bacterium]